MADQILAPTLRMFPPEIRNMIYVDCLEMKFTDVATKTPALLIALRGDPELYAEAIHIFYSINFFSLDAQNFQKIQHQLRKTCLESIRTLSIRVVSNWADDETSETAKLFRQFLTSQDSRLQLATNIEVLDLDWVLKRSGLAPLLLGNYAGYFPKLRYFQICVRRGDTVDDINDFFVNTKGKLHKITTIPTSWERWFWWEHGRPLQICWTEIQSQTQILRQIYEKYLVGHE